MKRRLFNHLRHCAVLLALNPSVGAGLPNSNLPALPAGPLTLAGAKELAIERNWDLLAAKSGVDSATGQWLAAKEWPNPNLSLTTARIGNYENATPSGNGIWARNYDTILAVSQLLEIGGKRRDRQAAARAGVLGAKARFLDACRLLGQGVTKAYVAALLAADNARILSESAGYMRNESQIAEARFHAGDLADSDLKQIQIAAAQYELQAKAAETVAVQARIAIEILLGVEEPKGELRLADSLDQTTAAAAAGAKFSSNARRPDLLAAESDLRAAQENLKLQKALRIPDPTLSIGYEHNPPGGGPPVDTLNLGVSFPLPVWNQNRGNISAAKAAVDQSEYAVGKIRAQAAADIANAEVAYQDAAERLERYRTQIQPRSGSARAAVAYKYEKGGATLVDLLEAERTDNEVRLALAQAQADTAGAAADLAAARSADTEAELKP